MFVVIDRLGYPKIETKQKRGSFVITCTAEASHYHPQIMWKVDLHSEIPGKLNYTQIVVEFSP